MMMKQSLMKSLYRQVQETMYALQVARVKANPIEIDGTSSLQDEGGAAGGEPRPLTVCQHIASSTTVPTAVSQYLTEQIKSDQGLSIGDQRRQGLAAQLTAVGIGSELNESNWLRAISPARSTTWLSSSAEHMQMSRSVSKSGSRSGSKSGSRSESKSESRSGSRSESRSKLGSKLATSTNVEKDSESVEPVPTESTSEAPIIDTGPTSEAQSIDLRPSDTEELYEEITPDAGIIINNRKDYQVSG